ncbi:amino acid adenylation domain-containing protein [Pseudoalteromonas sp. MMG013]|uniref:non-ribosomal peptide synthetase n=1 Tax=Pseudoalteromonas sp. MMG013 TaxID=2822687 RepID=UPI001B35CB29|nr:non-ribosomal peptide synthetase [Pseudoalteromonas sp. MMG013]MBQ4862205.1 amino acid adenylation domain-containing protein [Pseudoalteromonas sp. MMG013]
MSIRKIIENAALQGVILYVEEQNLKYRLTVESFPESIKLVVLEHKHEIIEYLSKDNFSKSTRPAISRIGAKSQKLSFAQQRLWLIEQLRSGSPEYNLPMAFKLSGRFDVDAAEKALCNIIERHEVLRTTFSNRDQEPTQLIHDDFEFCVSRYDLSEYNTQQQQNRVSKLIQQDASQPFDLTNDIMIRATHIQLSSEESEGVLLFNMHHIASDGWSMGILIKEFAAEYSAAISGDCSGLSKLPIQYADYAHWQRTWLQGEELDKQLSYWAKQLESLPRVHSLPLSGERPTTQQHIGQAVSIKIDKATSDRLQQVASAYKLTPFMLFHAALAFVLSKHSHNHDIVIGTPVANRMQAELEALIGFFVNTLVLRVNTDHQNINDYLTHVRQVNIDAQANQDIPFEQLIEHCQVQRSSQHNPLFQIMFSMNTNDRASLNLPEVSFSAYDRGNILNKFDLDVKASISETGVTFNWVYDVSLFSHEYICSLGSHLARVLSALADNSMKMLKDISILSEQEKYRLTHSLNETSITCSDSTLIHALFEEQVAKHPHKTALVFEGKQLSFQELNSASNQLAHYLRQQGVTTETLVGLCVDHCLEMVIGILAVLKAGGAYVPLNPNYPQARLQHILDDTQVKYVLSQVSVVSKLGSLHDAQIILLDEPQQQQAVCQYPVTNPQKLHLQNSNNLAYIIYTSGSTGQPKGVLIAHRNLINFGLSFTSQMTDLNVEPTKWLWSASYSFDASLKSIVSLWLGATVFVLSKKQQKSPQDIAQLLNQHQIPVYNSTPSMVLEVMSELYSQNQHFPSLIVSGEELTYAQLNKVMAYCDDKQQRAINAYGPTETCVNSSYQLLSHGVKAIGKCIANTQAYILDKHLRLVPFGAVGELYIAGSGLARGYLNQPQLTEERFINNPFSNGSGNRLYKTGDLVRYSMDGNLVFVGRNDDQVKIRGFRIELGEIEHALSQCHGVTSSIVMIRGEGAAQSIVGYVTTDDTDHSNDTSQLIVSLIAQLREKLPEYMIPSSLVVLEKLPLTLNGKIDKKALPEPKNNMQYIQYIAPKTATEEALVNVWAKLLNLEAENISTNADFFSIGGHSLLAIRLISEIRSELQQELGIHQLFERPTIESLASVLDQETAQNTAMPALKPIARQYNSVIAPSFSQQRLWTIDQLQNGSPEYNMPMAFHVTGQFDLAAAQQSMQNIIERHQVLRTVFSNHNNTLAQVVRDDVTFQIIQHDLSQLSLSEQQQKIASLVNQDISQPFDLIKDIMVRVAFIQLSTQGDKGIILFNMHHIASDGWSMGLLVKEFKVQYEAALTGQADPLPVLQIQYADYAHWQRNWLQGDVLNRQLTYWQKQLDNVPALHGIPLDKARPQIKKHKGQVVSSQINKTTSERLYQIAKEHQLTNFMLFHAALALVLSRHANSQDVVIGTPVANRMHADLESLIGFFVNTLVLRVDTSDTSLSEYLAHIRQVNIDAQANQELPFEQLLEVCNTPRSSQYTPLFQIMFSMNTISREALSLSGVSFTPYERSGIACKFDLDINAAISDDGITFNWVYDESLFTHAHITSMAEHLTRLLSEFSNPRMTELAQLPMLSEQEAFYQTHTLNSTQADYPKEALFHQLFEEKAASQPDDLALLFTDHTMTYHELNASANRLAHYLQAQGVSTETLVGIYVERSLEMVVGIFAILKAGAAYVPLDPKYPKSRLEYMLEDTQIKHVLTQSKVAEQFTFTNEIDVVRLDDVWMQKELNQYPTENPIPSAHQHSRNLAYVIYTSGSTGAPKGVMVEHRSLVNTIMDNVRRIEMEPGSISYQATSIAFDASVWLIWNTLIAGATVRLASTLSFQAELTQYADVTHLFMTPSMLESVDVDACPFIKVVIVGGENCSPDLVNRWTQQGKVFLNAYGPTEVSIVSSMSKLAQHTQPHIGKPSGNVQYLVLNDQLQIVPIGTIGELYIGGDGLARGYLNLPELTRERFIAHPLCDDPNSKLYKTGDLVRYLEDGNVAFIGRNDDQVKVRGFRIELGEIEHVLSRCEHVNACTITIVGEADSQRLAGYVTVDKHDHADDSQFTSALKAQLQEQLPNHMVPSTIMVLDSLPLTPNGKVNRQALPVPSCDTMLSQGEYVAPTTDTEHSLVQICSNLLKQEAQSISVAANFFDIGGHSLLAIRLISEIKHTLDKDLSVQQLFEHSTIRTMASTLDAHNSASLSVPELKATVKEPGTPVALSFAQQRLWMINQLQGASPEYHMPMVARVSGLFDLAAAQLAMSNIITRHHVLRTVFNTQVDDPVQVVRDDVEFNLVKHDLTKVDKLTQHEQVAAIVQQDIARPFNLRQDIMLRATFIQLSEFEDNGVLIFNMHHIASDGWSMGLLIKEFALEYEAAIAAQPSPVPDLKIQYADYALWQRQWLQGEVLKTQLHYWLKQLEDVPAVHGLPLDKPRPPVKKHIGQVVSRQIDKTTANRLEHFAKQQQLTPFMLFHAVLSLVLSRHSNSQDIVIGTPVANRKHVDLEPLIGFFVNTLVLRVNTHNQSVSEYLAHVRQVNIEAQAHQDIPFEQLVEHCNVLRCRQYTPLFQIMFSMNTNEQEALTLPGVNFSAYERNGLSCKFDLDINAAISEQGISFNWVYDESIFSQQNMAALAEHLVNALSALVDDSVEMIKDLPMLSKQEAHYLTHSLNDTKANYPSNKLIHQLFESGVEKSPDSIALAFKDKSMSYQELNSAANRLAHYLREQGITKETLVGIYLERSLDMVVGILAVMKAGGAYVPLDPNYPQDRIQYMLADSQIRYVVSQTEVAQQIGALSELNILCLDDGQVQSEIARYSAHNLAVAKLHQSSPLAYVIYTSGSTGQPKGVMVEHRGLINTVVDNASRININANSSVYQATSTAFDAAIWAMWTALISGAQVRLASTLSFQTELSQYADVTHLFMTPSMLESLDAESCPFIDVVIVGGEHCSNELVAKWTRQGKAFFNGYGPTEISICSSIGKLSSNSAVHIGKPNTNVQYFVLDECCHLVPKGTIGELYIGGDGLARGYLNRPELTKERFIQNPFDSNTQSRLYRTGDLVRYLADGNIEFIGRNDEQVKLRGFRIELDEVDRALTQCSGTHSTVTTFGGEGGIQGLIGYIATSVRDEAQVNQLTSSIHSQLQEKLPSYMVPTTIIAMESLPLTPNGKIDKQALPKPDISLLHGKYVAPHTETEKSLVQIWANLLNLEVEKISVEADFYQLGGHSLLLVKLLYAIQSQFEKAYELQTLFRDNTIHAQALSLDSMQTGLHQSSLLGEVSTPQGASHGVFFIPGAAGTAKDFVEITDNLTYENVAMAVFRHQGLITGESPFSSIEQNVTAFAACLESVDYSSLTIVGHSYGGVLALELAKHLHSLGYNVNIVMLDTYFEQHKLRHSPAKKAFTDTATAGVPEFALKTWQHQAKLFSEYRIVPQPQVPMSMILATESPYSAVEYQSYLSQVLSDHTLQYKSVVGNHFSILKGKGAKEIAKIIKNQGNL